MPPWSSRLLSPSSRNETGTDAAPGSSRSPARPRVTEADIIDNAFDIPTLFPPTSASRGATNTLKPMRTPSHGHGRSKSHPFPSLFSGKKNHDGQSAGGVETMDDETASPSLARNAHSKAAGKQKVPEKDLKTGKCMTCDSMVRWPKELKVFRCTVCLTINDLKPIALEARPDGHRVVVIPRSGKFQGPRQLHNGLQTKWIYWSRCADLSQLPCLLREPGGLLINV